MTKKTTKKVTRRYKVLVNSKDGKFVKGRSYAESTILRANEMAIQRLVGFDKSKFEEEKKNFIIRNFKEAALNTYSYISWWLLIPV